MSYAVNVHKLFWLDIAEAKIYYESVSTQISDTFDDAVDKAYQNLIQNPKAYFNLSKHIRVYQFLISLTKLFILLQETPFTS